MPLVSITRLRLRAWRFLPMFVLYSFRSARQASRAQGNLATRILQERHRTFWTATAWTDEVSMKGFMIAGAHGKAMRKLLEWCDEASLARWNQDTASLPSWQEAHARLERDGRPSKVNHPSPAHLALHFPTPVVRSTSEATLK